MPMATTSDGDVLIVCGVSGNVAYVHSFNTNLGIEGLKENHRKVIIIIIIDYIHRNI